MGFAVELQALLRGATAMGCLAAGLIFLRFGRTSSDRLFLLFAIAFWILGLDYVLLGLIRSATEWHLPVFIVRLIAFALILYAIAEKNRQP